MIKQREIELDVLRVIAMFAVVIVHTCGMETHNLPITDVNWQILTFIAGIMTWQIPVFVMISGRFFLDPKREMNADKIRKSVCRLVNAFVFWDVIYQIYYIFSGAYSNLNWKGILAQALEGPYHFWYLHMLIWIYMLTPFLRKITQEKKLMEYFIILFLFFEFVTNYGVQLPFIGDTLAILVRYINFNFALGYSGYYVMGYYLYRYKISDKFEIPLYILGMIFIIGAGIFTVYRSVNIGIHEDWFTAYLMPNVAIESMAIYTFFVKRVSNFSLNELCKRIIYKLSEYSFGVYLIHALVLVAVEKVGITPIMINPFVMVPTIGLIVVVISNILIHFLRKTPCIGKKIT